MGISIKISIVARGAWSAVKILCALKGAVNAAGTHSEEPANAKSIDCPAWGPLSRGFTD